MDVGTKVQPVALSETDALCLKCHDGRRARRELHPIGRGFDGDTLTLPEGWPAPDGKIACVTCHDVRPTCRPERPHGRGNPAFIRDYQAGEKLAFCARCHVQSPEHRPYNPHVMLSADDRIVQTACRYCHLAATGDRQRMRRTGKPELRTQEVAVCTGCHSRHIDYFTPGHIGARVSARMKAYSVASGSAVGSPAPLPLASGDVVVCSTCHNPHQAGLFPAGSSLAWGARHIGGQQERFLFRGFGKDLCGACHNE